MSNENYVDSLLKAVGVIKYSGRLIYPDNGKFYVSRFGQRRRKCNSLPEAKAYIDSGITELRKKIADQQRLREASESNDE